MTPILKKIIIIVAVAGIIIFIAYRYMTGSTTNQDVLGTVVIDNSTSMGAEVINTLMRIKQLKIDDSLFKDEVYRSLKDYSIPISGQPKGRNNPFEPLSSSTPSSLTSQQSLPASLKSGTNTSTSGRASSTFSGSAF